MKCILQIQMFQHLVYDTSISIPSSAGITQKQLQTVVETIKTFFKG